jgi:hypothetical protein
MNSEQIPVIVLAILGALAIIGLAVLAFTPATETQFIQNTLGSVAIASVAAIAGLVRGSGGTGD